MRRQRVHHVAFLPCLHTIADARRIASLTSLNNQPINSRARRLEDLAAAIEASAGQQSITVDLQCMARDAPEILGLLAELVSQPALPSDKLALTKAQVANVLQHRDDNADSVARRWVRLALHACLCSSDEQPRVATA